MPRRFLLGLSALSVAAASLVFFLYIFLDKQQRPKMKMNGPAYPGFVWGISGERPEMFADPRLRALALRAARAQLSWDLFSNPRASGMPGLLDEQRRARLWFEEAQRAGIRDVMVSFKFSRDDPDYLPGPERYYQGISRTLGVIDSWGYKGMVKQVTAWNEPDLTLPDNPGRAGEFYRQIVKLCKIQGCTPVAGDFTDSALTRVYFERYLAASGEGRLWALHAYGAGRQRSLLRLKEIISWLPRGSRVYLTEQGGIVHRPGGKTQSEDDAAGDLRFLLDRAARLPQVDRFYVYQWQGEREPAWDSGLIDPEGETRAAYCTFSAGLARSNRFCP